MNKSELVATLAARTGLSKKEAEKVVGAYISTVSDTLVTGDRIQLIGFGTFSVKERPARTARNPRTGAEVSISASKVPVFKAGKGLKDKVNTSAKKKGKK